jgi:sirohydrochlorin ferrochelatase
VDTARHFTRFVAEFLRTLKAKGDQTDSEREHLTKVLKKLSQTRKDVVRMDAELRAKQAELSEKDAQAEATLETVLREKRDAQQSREEMKRLKVTTSTQKDRLESERNAACDRSTSRK